jgi:hypothetical protein
VTVGLIDRQKTYMLETMVIQTCLIIQELDKSILRLSAISCRYLRIGNNFCPF